VPESSIRFYYKSTCTTCRRIKTALRDAGFELNERDMSRQPLSAEEIDALIGDRPHTDFLNFRNVLFRERGYKTNPPSREEAIREMAEEPNLIRRPILVRGDEVFFNPDRVLTEH
jgi:Spx/MgsR family transcriptional regulator